MSVFWVSLGVTALAVVLVMAASFAVGKVSGKYSIIDAIWGPGFAVIGWVSLLVSTGHGTPGLRFLVVAMVTIWGVRLGVHILRRNHGQPEDPRYVEMLKDSGPAAIAGKVQLPQGIAMWFVSIPVQLAMVLERPAWWLVSIGILLWLVGLAFEATGDAQLAAFKRDPSSKGTVLNTGLWRYTRHPNYFGDTCVWWGIFLTVAWTWSGALTILSPLAMTYLLVSKTGKALTEKRMSSSKPGYADYLRSTSGFIPLPPKKVR
ncbi:MAG: DUF1295 domain-containing protein [Nakamurella sp.]